MINYIDLSRSKKVQLPYMPNTEFQAVFEGKGWSFSNVYHFSELKDIFLAIKKIGYQGNKDFARRCVGELKIKPATTAWDAEGRRILEIVNALKNFGLLDSEYKVINQTAFDHAKIGEAINETDKLVFKDIYFSYYRFKEMMSWLVDPYFEDRRSLINSINEDVMRSSSKVTYPFSIKSRFTNSFIFELRDNTTLFCLDSAENESNGGILRFWDVFVKWGHELGLIEKFNLKNLDFQLASDSKSLSCIYFKNNAVDTFNLVTYIKNNYRSSYINLPRLIFKLATEFRYSIEHTKRLIIDQCLKYPDYLSLQRTSEVFIRDTEINFVPMVNDSYVSHILVQ